MLVRTRAYARVGLVGNPSDGYHGKTIAFTMDNFWAEAVVYESPELEIKPNQQDSTVFSSLGEVLEVVAKTGYYGGVRLMKAAVKKFAEYCSESGISLDNRNFTIRYETQVPRQVGLGGSSAILTAAMRALMRFFGVSIPDEILPNVVLAAETQELQLTAGLQDRVVQAYEGLVYMDFDKDFMERNGYGRYERLDPEHLGRLYLAYRTDVGQESSRAHLKVRELYELGDRKVIGVLNEIALLADVAREALLQGRADELPALVDRNFDLRAEIYPISEANMKMVRRARSVGASCKFCGSGGAVVGTCEDEKMFYELKRVMTEEGYEVIVPRLVGPSQGG